MTLETQPLDYAKAGPTRHARRTVQLLYAAALLQFLYTLWFAGGSMRVVSFLRSLGISWDEILTNTMSGIPLRLTLRGHVVGVIVLIALYVVACAIYLLAARKLLVAGRFWRFAAFFLAIGQALLTLGDIFAGTGLYFVANLREHGWLAQLFPSAIHLVFHVLLFAAAVLVAFHLPRYLGRPM